MNRTADTPDPDDAPLADGATLALVHRTWRRVATGGPAAGERFYQHLFRADPSLRRLFTRPAAEQCARLVQMLDVAVAHLERPRVLRGVLRELGQRHRGYGVQPAHYETVRGALLATLADGLGADFTPEARTAWSAVYRGIAQTMQEAALAHAA